MPRTKAPTVTKKAPRKRSGRKNFQKPETRIVSEIHDSTVVEVLPRRKRRGRRTQMAKRRPATIYPMGGNLIDPPEKCEWRRTFKDGGTWTDFGCCMTVCAEKCERYEWYKKASNEERQQDLIDRGCKNIYRNGKKET